MDAVLADPATAPIDGRLRAGLELVAVLTRAPDELDADHIEKARAAGLDDDDIRDAATVCALFSLITRLADSLEFSLPDSFEGSVKVLTGRMGYRLPLPALLLPRR